MLEGQMALAHSVVRIMIGLMGVLALGCRFDFINYFNKG